MECNVPTDIVFSFSGLALRGGLRGPHADGWGLALYEGKVARTFLDPQPASHSRLAKFVRNNPIKTLLAIAHVRKKTHGHLKLKNTHPFVRELWGRHWVFAHNGKLRGARELALGRFTPVGTTDSEHAFCHLLARLQKTFKAYPRDRKKLFEVVHAIGNDIGKLGTFNFLLADGDYLFARCSTKLVYIIRKAPFGPATLTDEDLTVDFRKVTTPTDRVAVIATTPLTRDEVWTHADPGTLWVFRRGALRATLK